MTVREIAKLAGVSIGTVDRVLHNRGRVSPEAAEKIGEILKTHNFTPNPIARRLKRNRAYKFCALVPGHDQDSGYWGQAIQGIREGALEIISFGIETEIMEYDHYNPEEFEEKAGEILEKAPDGLVFAPIDQDMAYPFIEKLNKKKIPYSFFDTELPGAKPVCTIVQDSWRGGYLAGKLLHLLTGKITGSVAVLYAPHSIHISRRKDGCVEYFKEQKIKATVKNYTQKDGAVISDKAISDFLVKQNDLQGIFVSYADVHQIAEAAGERKKNKKLSIVGYDLIPENYRLLKEGRIDAIISQRPQEQGRHALLSLYRRIVLENAVDPFIEMPLDIYMKENLPDENCLYPPFIK